MTEEEQIVDLYLIKKIPVKEILKTLNICGTTFNRRKNKYHIPNRDPVKPRKDWTGQKFNDWELISYIETTEKNLDRWLVRCVCGTTKKAYAVDVARKISIRCTKCWGKLREHPDELCPSIWNEMVKGAKKRNLLVSVTREHCYNLFLKQNRKCALTGVPIHFARNTNVHKMRYGSTASLDRIDSNKGYEEGNLQWLHTDINIMKLNYSEDKFINWCKLVAEGPKGNIYELGNIQTDKNHRRV